MEPITAILTVWKRDHLEEQIEALLDQSHPPTEIWVYHCHTFVKPKFNLSKRYKNIKYQFNTGDLGYFGRFSMGLNASTPFLYILDDDVIPSKNWIENSVNLSKKQNAIVCSSGRLIGKDGYRPEAVNGADNIRKYFVGDGDNSKYKNFCTEDTYVDFGCNSWVFETRWLAHFWSLPPFSRETGEDIHLSASCLIKAGIRTICPQQDGVITCGNLRKFYGFDEIASWRQPDFISRREKIIEYMIKIHGWIPQSYA